VLAVGNCCYVAVCSAALGEGRRGPGAHRGGRPPTACFIGPYTFTSESEGEKMLEICQHLAKLWTRVWCPDVFLTHGVVLLAFRHIS